MKKDLIKFNILYENIMNDLTQQKRSNVFTKFFTNQRYIEEDFQRVWEGSALKRLLYALDVAIGKSSLKHADNPNDTYVDINNMLDKKSAEYEDIEAGQAGATAGVKLTYDIMPDQKYYLLKTLLLRNEASDESNSKFGLFNDYINKLISQSEGDPQKKIIYKYPKQINVDVKLEVIAIAKSNDIEYSQNKKHEKLKENSFDCTLFIWFDAEQYKQELKNILNNTIADKTKVADASSSETNSAEILQQQEANIDKISSKSSKIKIGTITITLGQRELGKIADVATGLINYNLADPLLKMTGNALGVNKIFGTSKDTDDSSWDKIKINKSMLHSFFNLGDIQRPYIKVKSIVTLDKWLYNTDYLKSADSNNKNLNTAVQLRKQFNEKYLKIDENSPGKLTANIADGKVWATGDIIGRSAWTSKDIDNSTNMTDYLMSDTEDNSKSITCRWQYYLDSTRGSYAEYRVSLLLKDFYNCLKILELNSNKFEKILEILIASNYTVTHIENIINLLNKYPELIQTNKAITTTATKVEQDLVSTFINSWRRSISQNLNNSLTNYSDNFKNKSKPGLEILYYLIKNEQLLIKSEKSKDGSVDQLSLNNLFTDWWTLRFIKNCKLNNLDNFKISAQKKLFTSKGKLADMSNANHAMTSFIAFQDNDQEAAEYFNHNVLENTLTINSDSLNNLFSAEIENIKNIFTKPENKNLFNALFKFNQTLYKLSLNTNSNIASAAESLYIATNLSKRS